MSDYNGSDIYCDLIIPKKMAVKILHETEDVIAFYHNKPHWPTHIVVVPKKHIPSLLELENELAAKLLAVVKEVTQKVKDEQGSCRVLTNLGDYQDSKHLHVHVSSGQPL